MAQNEYHFEVFAPNGTHHEFMSQTAFPAVSVGDNLSLDLSLTDYSLSFPDGQEMRITKIQHHFVDFPEKDGLAVCAIWTHVWTELTPIREDR